jgi:hypothetical protein
MKPFNREKFLLYMLAGIFTWQAAVFTFGAISCFQIGEREACPNLGDRYENTVGIMVATTLALLGAGAVTNQKKSSVSDRFAHLFLHLIQNRLRRRNLGSLDICDVFHCSISVKSHDAPAKLSDVCFACHYFGGNTFL